MVERFTDRARRVLVLAQSEAREMGHQRVGTEHLLLGVLAERTSRAAQALAATGVTLEAARYKVSEAATRKPRSDSVRDELPFTARAQRAMERASRLSLQRRETHVDTELVLLAVLDVEGTAGQVLRGLGADLTRLRVELNETEAEVSEQPKVKPARSNKNSPRCPACGKPLDGALTWGLAGAVDAQGVSRDFIVSWCGRCGTSLGASPT